MDSLLDHAPCGFVAFDEGGTVTTANATLADMVGHAPEALVGAPLEQILSVPARIFYQSYVLPLLKLSGRADELYLTLASRTGAEVPVLTYATRQAAPGAPWGQCVFVRYQQRQQYEDELVALRRTAEHDARTKGGLTDIEAELERTRWEHDRLTVRLGQREAELAALRAIIGGGLGGRVRRLSQLARQAPDDRKAPGPTGALKALAAESADLETLVAALHAFVAVDEDASCTVPVDLNVALGAARRRVAARWPDAVLRLTSARLPVVEGSRPQLEALFFHLLDNAVKFRKPGAPADVTIDWTPIKGNGYRASEDRYRFLNFARVTATDYGIGFDGRRDKEVFEPMRQLAPETPGHGLGLALCKKVAENHHGTISVRSKPGEGARFSILLPLESHGLDARSERPEGPALSGARADA